MSTFDSRVFQQQFKDKKRFTAITWSTHYKWKQQQLVEGRVKKPDQPGQLITSNNQIIWDKRGFQPCIKSGRIYIFFYYIYIDKRSNQVDRNKQNELYMYKHRHIYTNKLKSGWQKQTKWTLYIHTYIYTYKYEQ